MTERDDKMPYATPSLTPDDDPELAPFLQAARGEVAQAGDDFLARIMADADRVQATFTNAEPAQDSPARLSLWAALRDALGGWGPASALAASVAVGFWVGYGDPSGLAAQAGLFGTSQSTETVDIFTALDDFAVEG